MGAQMWVSKVGEHIGSSPESFEDAGRDPGSVSTTLFAATPETDYLQRCREAKVDRALLALPSKGRDEVLPILDKFQAFLN